MPDSLLWRRKGDHLLDDEGAPLVGGKLEYRSATTDLVILAYLDADLSTAHPSQIELSASGQLDDPVYLPAGDFKETCYDADDNVQFVQDDYPGPVADPAALTTAEPLTPLNASSLTTTTILDGDDLGYLWRVNPSAGSFTVYLPDVTAITVGRRIGFRNNSSFGSGNVATIMAATGQTIRGQRAARMFNLVESGEVIWLIASGSFWTIGTYVPHTLVSSGPYFLVADRLTGPPAYPAAGTRYLINGTPTGLWATLGFADEQIVEADGNASWFAYTPAEGWLVHDVDGATLLQFRNGSWYPLDNIAPLATNQTRKIAVLRDTKAEGTVGGTATPDAWTTAEIQTEETDTIGVSIASSEITLPAGTYRVTARKSFYRTEESQIRFKTADDDSIIIQGEVFTAGYLNSGQSANAFSGAIAHLDGVFEIAAATDFILQYYVAVTNSTSDLGKPQNASGLSEIYATIVIESLVIEATQGVAGAQGAQGTIGPTGAAGPATDALWFSTKTAADAATIDGSVDYIRTEGYAVVGDAPARTWKRIATPSPVEPWHFTSADGAYWELIADWVCLEDFGGKNDGLTASAAVNDAAWDDCVAWVQAQPLGGKIKVLAGDGPVLAAEHNCYSGDADNVIHIEWEIGSRIWTTLTGADSILFDFTNVSAPTTRSGGVVLTNPDIWPHSSMSSSDIGPVYMDTRYASWHHIVGEAGELVHYRNNTVWRQSGSWNNNNGALSVYGGGHRKPRKSTGTITFSITASSTTLEASGSVFAAGDVGDIIVVGDEMFTISAVTDADTATVSRAASYTHTAERGSFGSARCTTIATDATIEMESTVMVASDVGRVVYILDGAAVGALRAVITSVTDSNTFEVDVAPANSLSNAEIIFSPAVEIVYDTGAFDGQPNDMAWAGLQVEDYRGTGLVVEGGVGITFKTGKLHGVNGFYNDTASDYAMLINNSSVRFDGIIEGTTNGRLGRVLIHGAYGGVGLGPIQGIAVEYQPLVHMQYCLAPAVVTIDDWDVVNSTTAASFAAAFTKTGDGKYFFKGAPSALVAVDPYPFYFPTATAAAIAAVGNVVNTHLKRAGRAIFDTTNNRLMIATGSAAADTWRVADNSATVTPS